MYNHVNKMTIGYGNEEWGRLPAGGVPPPPPPSFPNPAALYRLDGDGLDASGNGRDLIIGTMTFDSGRFGQGATGTNGEIASRSPSPISGPVNTSYTISAWMRRGGRVTISDDTESSLIVGIGSTGIATIVYGESDIQRPGVDTEWHHVAAVITAGSAALWVDGTTASPLDVSWSVANFVGLSLVMLGGSGVRLDDVAIVTSALTAEQIAYLAAGHPYPV